MAQPDQNVRAIASGNTTLLRAVGIRKSYDGVHALRNVSFNLKRGEVHALIGENGAGKSTLIKIITGAVQPDGGMVEIAGNVIKHNSPAQAKANGIAAIYQQPALFPELSVAENIALGLERGGPFRRVNWKKRKEQAKALLDRIGAKIDPTTEVSRLTMPEQQLIEIARAVGANARVLIMDEPTASLAEEETQNLYRVIHQLRESGVGIIYISHRLEELPLVADTVTVLRDGEVVDTRPMKDVSTPELIRMMVGRELAAVFPKQQVKPGEVVLEVRGLGCHATGIHDVDLTVRSGEIIGVAGLVGAGRTELAQSIFGLAPADVGEIRLQNRPVSIRSPQQAISLGIAYVPEDRRQHGVVLEMPITENITLASLKNLRRGLSFDFEKEKTTATHYVRRFAIKTPAIFAPVTSLSGGNQQKVALSRWLETKPSVLILDEPTQGIDVGAKAEIHTLMGELAAHGVAILMISSELPEILGMSDRVIVMRAGTVAGVIDRNQASQQGIMSLALGQTLAAA